MLEMPPVNKKEGHDASSKASALVQEQHVRKKGRNDAIQCIHSKNFSLYAPPYALTTM